MTLLNKFQISTLASVFFGVFFCSSISYCQFESDTCSFENGKLISCKSVILYDHDGFALYKIETYFQDSVGAYQEINCNDDYLKPIGISIPLSLPDSIYGDYDTITYNTKLWIRKGDSRRIIRQKNLGKYKGPDTVYTRIERKTIATKLITYTNYLIENKLIDTFYIDRSEYFEEIKPSWSQRVKTEYQYYKGKKHGLEIGYFSNQEIKESCSKPPFIKYRGEWEENHKHGKWVYYNTLGEIIKEEKFKHGVLIKCKD